MALDFHADDAPRRWFGFSPVVVVISAVVLVGGGTAVASASHESYVESLTHMCADAQAAMGAEQEARDARNEPLPSLAGDPVIFKDIIANTDRRLRALRAIRAEPSRAETHAGLIAAEERVVAVSTEQIQRYRREGLSTIQVALREAVDAMADADALYVELGVPKGCAD